MVLFFWYGRVPAFQEGLKTAQRKFQVVFDFAQEAKRRNVDQTWVQAWLARLELQIKVRESAPSLPLPCSRLSLRAFRR